MITNEQYQKAQEIVLNYRIEAEKRIERATISPERQDEIIRVLSNYVPELVLPTYEIKPICVAIEYLCENYNK